jgi:hypothetical protein
VSKFAQLEYKFSSPEHGRTIMTGLLANYPRRFDLWSISLDLEIKQGEKDVIRCLTRLIQLMEDGCSSEYSRIKCRRRRRSSFLRNGCSGKRKVAVRRELKMSKDVLRSTSRGCLRSVRIIVSVIVNLLGPGFGAFVISTTSPIVKHDVELSLLWTDARQLIYIDAQILQAWSTFVGLNPRIHH